MAAGFAAGIVLRETAVPRVVEPVGTLWINAIRMPVLPLIVAMLIASIGGSRDPRAIGTLGARTLGVMLAVLSFFAVIMVPLSVLLLGGLTFDPASTASLREAAAFDPALLQQVSLREWLLSLVPNNPIRAAADGALLPLVIFSLAYGLALSRVSDGTRETHVRFCQGVADAMTTRPVARSTATTDHVAKTGPGSARTKTTSSGIRMRISRRTCLEPFVLRPRCD